MTPEGGTVADALGRARALGIDRLDSQLLLASTLQRTREWLIAHGDAALSEDIRRSYLPASTLSGRPTISLARMPVA